MSDQDYQYYNFKQYNPIDNGGAVKAEFKENRIINILNNPKDYDVIIHRFAIPGNYPIFIYPANTNIPGEVFPPFSMVMYITAPKSAIGTIPFQSNVTGDLYNRGIYTVQQFLKMVNTAFQTLFDFMKLTYPIDMTPTQAPYLTYDSKTDLVSLNVQQIYATANIRIFFSGVLFNNYFPSLQQTPFGLGGVDASFIQLSVKDNKNNSATLGGTPYYVMTQEFSTTGLFNGFSSILFETDTIPVEPEFLGAQSNQVRRVLSDFEVSSEKKNRQIIQFFPRGLLRKYVLTLHYPLRSMDLKIILQTPDGSIYPLYLYQDDYFSLKLGLKKNREIVLKRMIQEDGLR